MLTSVCRWLPLRRLLASRVPRGCRLAEVVALVARFLPDKTALAATASFARCAAHHLSYVIDDAAWSAWTCSFCGSDMECKVHGHEHFCASPPCAGAFVRYLDVGGAGYVWWPSGDAVACAPCAASLGADAVMWQRMLDAGELADFFASAVY